MYIRNDATNSIPEHLPLPGNMALTVTLSENFSGIKTQDELNQSYFGKVMVAFGKSWSPNPDKPPFFCDMPFEFEGDELIVHTEVLKKWHANMPLYMIDKYLKTYRR